MKKDKEWLKNEINKVTSRVYGADFNTIKETDDLIDQLEEPEQKKVVVNEVMAGHIENCKNLKLTLSDGLHLVVSGDKQEEVLFARAWLNGYTVEKEPQWVVKDDTGYLSYLQFSIPNIYERETSLDKNDAYKFNSKSKADLVADLVGGIVVEVSE